MKFQGYWVASQDSKLSVSPAEFDETDLTEASNWTEAHQNEDPTLPHGFTDPGRVLAEVAARWLSAHPEVQRQLAAGEQGEVAVNTLEEFGRLCLLLAPALKTIRAAPPASQLAADAPGKSSAEIPFS